MRKHVSRLMVLAAAGLVAAGCGDPKVSIDGLKLVRPKVSEPTSRDVEKFVRQMLDQMATASPLPSASRVANGCRVLIDFVGTTDGKPFPGGTASGYAIVLGSGQMIPGFEAGIVGMRAGESREVKVVFPKDYSEASLAGKPASFRVTVKAAETLKRPALTNDLASRVSQGRINTVAELKTAIRAQLRQTFQQQAEQALRAQAAEQLLARWPKKPGKKAVKQELDRMVEQQLAQASQRGSGPAQGGPDAEALRTANLPLVEKSVRFAEMMSAIAKQQGIIVTDVEVEQLAARLAQGQGQTPEVFLDYLRKNNLMDSLRRRLTEDKVMELVIQKSQIAEGGRTAL
jgi:trigger factor